MNWPGPGPEADLLVLEHVLRVDTRGATAFNHGDTVGLPANRLPDNRVMLPKYTRDYATMARYVIEPLEDEGWYFQVGNLNGHYEAVVRVGKKEYRATSRHYAAEAMCLAALQARGHQIGFDDEE